MSTQSNQTYEQLAARIKELEAALKPKPKPRKKRKGLPSHKINFVFQF